MCGVAGVWDRRRRSAPTALAAVAEAMTEALRYRGPDAGAVYADAAAGLALGHRRLSIVDLSPAGAQPMVSSCGRFVISYNGEIYNADELRPELEAAGRRFRGHCDTEVIVEGAAVWGVAATITRLIGMFAIALWDRRERGSISSATGSASSRSIGRSSTGALLFGSELKALRADPSWTPALDRDALAAYLRFGYVPAPHTIYRGVRKLPPGTILTVDADGRGRDRALTGRSPTWRAPARRSGSRSARTRPPTGSMRCCAMRSGGGWWRTCRLAPFFPAASIPRPWSR